MSKKMVGSRETLAKTGEPLDTQDLSALLRNDSKWKQIPSPISVCVLKRNRFTLYMNLTLALSIVLNILILNSEFIGTGRENITQGVSGFLQVPVTILAFTLVNVMIVLMILIFLGYQRLSLCHSISIQLVIRQVGVDSPEFPEIYRRTLVDPLVRSTANQWLIIMATITSALTPIMVRLYQGVLFTEIVDMFVVFSFGISFVYVSLISESIRHSRRQSEHMSDVELKNHSESFLEKDKEKANRWLQHQLRRKVGRPLTEKELKPLLQVWYDEYLFRDADTLTNISQITRLPFQEDNKIASKWILVFGLVSTILWIVNSLVIVFLHLPAPAI
jgi:hypothetical protein